MKVDWINAMRLDVDGSAINQIEREVEEKLICPSCGAEFEICFGHHGNKWFAWHPISNCPIKERYFCKGLGKADTKEAAFKIAQAELYPAAESGNAA